MNVVIHGPNLNDQSKGTFRVHQAACRDNRWEETRNASVYPMEFEAASVDEVVETIYADQLRESPGSDFECYVADFHFAPCCAELLRREEESH